MYDLIVAGGGTSGISTAISAAKQGLKVLVIEKNSFLGGSMTGALVVPMMKNMLKNGKSLSGEFVEELMAEMRKTSDALTYSDNNIGWFNPDIMKCTLDDLFQKYNIEVFFDTVVTNANISDNKIQNVEITYAGQKQLLEAKYFVDATGNADLVNLCGGNFENGNDGINQAMTLRFIASNVDIKKFAEFLKSIDDNREVSPISEINGEIHLSTACTWDNDSWKLKPYFKKAVADGVLEEEDCAYFQIFTIPNQPSAIAFNAPRIFSEKPLNPLDVKDTSFALIQGRKQIRRLMAFCKKYLAGFENAYISQIAPMLGIRDSRRIEGEYTMSEEDVLSCKKFKNALAKSNYPIDVHSLKKDGDILNKIDEDDYFEIPLESAKVRGIKNLFAAGKIVSATFLAQAALRIIPNCLSMGESLGKHIAELAKNPN
ncbi:MAG: FAD-dependent oxidoreductase [bacterium]|nr:FAD-dependent oxidoreductase [bacterium]